MDHLCNFCRARLFIDALWSPAVKGLTSWLSFVMSYCEFVTFPLVCWVRCGTWLYRFLIVALFLILPWKCKYSLYDREYMIKMLVRPENTTITHWRPNHGTKRKSHRTLVTRHQEDNKSKATSSLFLVKMIAKQEWILSMLVWKVPLFCYIDSTIHCSSICHSTCISNCW